MSALCSGFRANLDFYLNLEPVRGVKKIVLSNPSNLIMHVKTQLGAKPYNFQTMGKYWQKPGLHLHHKPKVSLNLIHLSAAQP